MELKRIAGSPVKFCAIATLCASATFSPAYAQIVPDPNIIIDLPDFSIQPNTTASFDVFVQNTSGAPRPVNGIGFYIEVLGSGPTITAVNLLPATSLFGEITNSGQNGTSTGPQGSPRLFYNETSTVGSSTTVDIPTGSKFLATVTINSTGIAPGLYDYTLDTSIGPAVFTTTSVDLTPTLLPGKLTVVPEPAVTALTGGLVCLAVGIFHSYRRRSA